MGKGNLCCLWDDSELKYRRSAADDPENHDNLLDRKPSAILNMAHTFLSQDCKAIKFVRELS